MITFEDKLPKYETDITISDLGEGCFLNGIKLFISSCTGEKAKAAEPIGIV